jgi:Concanavalin A-like lectin/glucanases superfamily
LISPVWLGSRTLYVQAVDRAGNLSPDDSSNLPAEFNVVTIRPTSNPTPLLAWWKLNEGSGTTAADATGNGHGATLGAQAGWGPGRVSGTSALSLTGASDSEAFTAPALPPVDNTGSFTVSAWVKLSPSCASSPSTCGFYDPVSMDGTVQGAFALEYVDQTWCGPGEGDGVHGCWAFTMTASDTTSPPASTVEAANTVVFGTWVHLTGVYDQVHQTIAIYVNGQPASALGPVGGVQPWAGPAMGPLRIGRVLFNGGAFNWWPGEVSDVCAFWGALDATQVSNVFNSGCGSAGSP